MGNILKTEESQEIPTRECSKVHVHDKGKIILTVSQIKNIIT